MKTFAIELCKSAANNDIYKFHMYASANIPFNLTDYDGRTPLHVAVSKGNKEVIKVLLMAGANPEAKDNFGYNSFDETKDQHILDLLSGKVRADEGEGWVIKLE